MVSLKDIENFLQNVTLFQGLKSTQKKRLAKMFIERT